MKAGSTAPGEIRALCIGPSDWLLVSSSTPSGVIRDRIDVDDVRQGLAIVDLSSGLSVIGISGPAARSALAKGCGLDFGSRHFSCARTRLAQIAVVIDTADRTDGFELYVARSLTTYLEEWLFTAADCRF